MTIRILFACFVFALVLPPSVGYAEDIDCLKCHAQLKQQKVVHPALDMGCASCHSGIDASSVPHKKKGAFPKGLSAEQPDLCYGCHDKTAFTKTNVHAAVGMGCTGCHNPHSSKNPKLLLNEVPGLCFSCHDQAPFSKAVVHPPVAGGMCLSCHTPHASNEVALLLKKPYDLCLDCHAEIPTRPHAVAGFGGGHPLGKMKKKKKKNQSEPEIMDPARPGRTFYCGSCHNPHSSATGQLFRYDAKSSMGLCTNCHKR